jgi:hypothetical protein
MMLGHFCVIAALKERQKKMRPKMMRAFLFDSGTAFGCF